MAMPIRSAVLRMASNSSGAASKNVLIVVSAGNSAQNLDVDEKNCMFPQCFDSENLIHVAEIDFQGRSSSDNRPIT